MYGLTRFMRADGVQHRAEGGKSIRCSAITLVARRVFPRLTAFRLAFCHRLQGPFSGVVKMRNCALPIGSTGGGEVANGDGDVCPGRIPLHSRGVSIFGRSGGRARIRDRADLLSLTDAIEGGLRADRDNHPGRRPSAAGVLRLRTAVAGALHRAGFPGVQRSLRRDPWQMGNLSTARPILSPAAMSVRRSTRRASHRFHAFSYTVRGSTRPRRHSSLPGSGEAREGERATPIVPFAAAKRAPRPCARRHGTCSGEMERRLGALGVTGRHHGDAGLHGPRLIRSWATRSSGAGPRERVSLGISAGLRCRSLNTKWIAEGLLPSASSRTRPRA